MFCSQEKLSQITKSKDYFLFPLGTFYETYDPRLWLELTEILYFYFARFVGFIRTIFSCGTVLLYLGRGCLLSFTSFRKDSHGEERAKVFSYNETLVTTLASQWMTYPSMVWSILWKHFQKAAFFPLKTPFQKNFWCTFSKPISFSSGNWPLLTGGVY